VARLLGLSSLLKSTDEQERNKILGLMTTSTQELDQIIRDINLILEIDKLNTQALNRLDIHDYLVRAIDLIRPDIEITGSEIEIQLNGIPQVPFLGPYMESILYNLISNAIKYRDPERKLMIVIRGFEEQGFVKLEISDNGLGIDLQRFKQDLFKLYKRFHTHV
jgi:signal transduction histidine kinase